MNLNEEIITLENVTKIYDGKHVIDNVSHIFSKGESIAFLGHNGCGKSTMLKLLSGIITISSGHLVYHKKLKFSYVPERFPGMEISLIDYLQGISKMEKVDFSVANKLIGDFYLDSMIKTRLDKLSKGSLQKVGVIQAILAPQDVILLDEPLSGQDADSQKVFITKMNELREKGVTIFMACHEKTLINELSDKAYTIENGKLLEVKDPCGSDYSVYIRKNPVLTVWLEMRNNGNRYEITVKEEYLKETVLKLYDEGWEIVGIEKLA
ncbi:MAG: ATP-binding cassette domain-containing protein [Lachnospiraceae bacterium]|nr:ATP-binding cassette domain-containing protein [Lachnospiraceae bacterium]